MADISVLNKLEIDRIQQAFSKARDDGHMPGFQLLLVTHEHYDKALDFIRDHFITKEMVHRSAGLQWTNEVKESCLQAFKLNLSLMFVSENNGEAAAVLRAATQSRKTCTDLDTIHTIALQEAVRFNNVCDDKADFFGHFCADEAFRIEALAVAEKYQKRGLASRLFKAAITMTCNLGIDPVYIKVEGSSKYSKKIFEDAGFETLCEVPFDTWDFPVKCVKTDEHTSQKN